MISESTFSDGFGTWRDRAVPENSARGAPETAKYRLKPPYFRGFAYSGSIPTMTAPGVPHLAFAPVWLLRQTIFIGLAGAAGVAAG